MKKALKIVAWTLLGIIVAILIVASVAVWVVFTPKRLTPIVRSLADTYITCPSSVGEVDLTFFSTFPRFGLRADQLLVVNPTPGAPSDTLLYAPQVVAVVNVSDLMTHNRLVIHDLQLNDVFASVYIGDSVNNFTVFNLPTDTTDTSATVLPFDGVEVENLSVSTTCLNFRHRQTDYAKNVRLVLSAPLQGDINRMHFELPDALLQVNDFRINLAGNLTLQDSIAMDLMLATNEWQILPLLELIPDSLFTMPRDIALDGILQVQQAHIYGIYSDSTMPLIDARLLLKHGEGEYAQLPYRLTNVNLDAQAHIDLNDSTASGVQIHNLSAQTKQTTLSLSGEITNLLADMRVNVQANVQTRLKDLAYFLPKDLHANGNAELKANVDICLSDLQALRLHKGNISGTLRTSDLNIAMDSLTAAIPKADLTFAIPNRHPEHKKTTWGAIDMNARAITAEKIDFGTMNMGATTLHAEASNILDQKNPVLVAAVNLSTTQLLADADSMFAHLDAPNIRAYAEYNSRTRNADKLSATINAQRIEAKMDTTIHILTDSIHLEASARYRPDQDNVLLTWNPRLRAHLTNGHLNAGGVPMPVHLPTINFAYSNRAFTINSARVLFGNSNFNLTGEVRNIGQWLRKQAVLEGEMDLISSYTDVNQILAVFSDDKGSEESETEVVPELETIGEQEPFLVPLDMDLALNTRIAKARVFEEDLMDLGGRLYVKDGRVILEEIGFTSHAARMQLTGMYRSPRRNHLYAGFDLHLLDVEIAELLHIVPDIDTIIPMLSAFDGKVRFHLAGETYLKADYSIKPSTLRAAMSLQGKDITVLDNDTYDRIAKLLMFNRRTENRIDSLNAEVTVYKKEITVYPLCVTWDNYMVALGGNHYLDMTFNYDVNVLKPIYLGVNVSGAIDDLDIHLAPCKFAADFRPNWFHKADNQSHELRQLIRQSMERNVRIE